MSEKQFENKVVVVTGASRGLGKSIAEFLGKQGATVIGTATSSEGAEKISTNFAEQQILGCGLPLNVTNEESIENFFKQLEEKYTMPDILVNNAGITRDNLMLRMSEEEWLDVINTNLNAVFILSKRVLKSMLKKRWGRIINISSVSGCTGLPGQTNYSAAKAGVIGFSKALAKEIAKKSITVNVVAPGFIKSDMTDALSEQHRQQIMNEIPMAREGNPEEIAATVAFLASNGAAYITGETIHVNGGLYMV
jgi:3-oxoacyl-[acyl-carrier protein] reductase